MKPILTLSLSVLFFSLSAHAEIASIDGCTIKQLETQTVMDCDNLTIGKTEISVAISDRSEPLFTTVIEMRDDGEVYLLRKNKADVFLGKGSFPDEHYSLTSFTLDPNLDIKVVDHKEGIPFPLCGFEDGIQCSLDMLEKSKIEIVLPSEKIVFTSRDAVRLFKNH